MALIIDPDNLNQGLSLSISDAVFTASSGANTTITSAGNNLPKLAANDYFEVRDHSNPVNNGLYIATGTPSVSSLSCTKVDGVNPADAASEAIRTFGDNVESYGVPGGGVAVTTNNTITKVGGTSFITAGFKVGGAVTITLAEDVGNNGSWTLSSVSADVLVVSGTPLTNNAADTTMSLASGQTSEYKSVHIDTSQKRVYLIEKGSLSVDGVTLQSLYSFLKEEWKSDADLIQHTFPVVSITPEQFEFIEGWEPRDVTSPAIQSKKLIRTAGWSEVSTTDIVTKQYTGIITLGTFEDDANDTAYYQLGNNPVETGAATDFTFAGPVNEAVKTYEDYGVPGNLAITGGTTITKTGGTSFITFGFKVGGRVTISSAEDVANNGSWVLTAVTADTLVTSGLTNNADDDTMRLAADNRNQVNVFVRERDADPFGKTFDKSTVAGIGFTAVDNKAFRFPLSNATDLNIEETDANIAANTPYTQIVVRYFDQAFNREVDGATNRNFGIVIDVGTHSGVDGSAPGAGSVLTTSEGGMGVNAYAGGTLRIHEGTDENLTFPIVSNTATTITVTGTLSAGTNISFTAQRATPVVASKQQIYEKIQYLLRQAADIDSTDQTVTGRTGDELLEFVGPDLKCGSKFPTNPNGGGSGVIIEGFDANDTNNLFFFDNLGTQYSYPFVAAGTINFNANLYPSDSAPEYWMFFEYTLRDTVPDFAISAATGSTASFDSAGANLPTVAQNDYVRLSGSAFPANNGIWVVTDAAPTASQFDARKIDGQTVVNETSASRNLDLDPIDSPQAIIVNNNAGSPITGNVTAASIAFDFDYDNNVQGGRTAATDAPIVIRAIGLEDAQFAETTGTITRATGLSFSVVAALERNYTNP